MKTGEKTQEFIDRFKCISDEVDDRFEQDLLALLEAQRQKCFKAARDHHTWIYRAIKNAPTP